MQALVNAETNLQQPTMNLSIQPLIDLADTDRELQAFIYSKSNLEKKIDTASSIVNQHKKIIEEKMMSLTPW